MAKTVNIVDLDIDQKELVKKLELLKRTIDDNKSSVKKLTDENKELEKAGKKGGNQHKANAREAELLKLQTKGLSTEYRDNQKTVTSLTISQKAQIGTIQQLELSNKKLRQESKTLDLTRKDGQARLKDINKQLDQNNKTILENADAAKKQTMNIGNYGSALGGLPGPMAGAVSGGQRLLLMFKTLIANPVGLILAAIALAIKAISDAFKRNQGAMDKLKQMGAGLSAAYGAFLDRINAIIQAFKKFDWQTILRGFMGLGEEMKEDFKTAKELTAALQELYRQGTVDIEQKALLRQAIEKARLESKKSNITEQERLVFLQEAMRLEEELMAIQLADADKRVEIAVAEGEINKNTDEEDRAIAEAKVARIDLETASMKRRRTIASELKTVEIKAAKEKLEAAEASALIAAKAVDNEIQLERIKSLTINEIKDADVEKEKARSQTLKVVHQEVAEVDIELAELVSEHKLDIAQSYLKGIVGLFGAQSKIGKLAAVSETAINTYRGAQAAYASLAGIPVVGPGLGIAAAGAAVLMGLANVKKILAVKTPGGGSGGGGGGGRPSISTGSIPRQYATAGAQANGGLTTSGITDSISTSIKQAMSEALKESPPILVVEDVTNKQMRQNSVSKVATV